MQTLVLLTNHMHELIKIDKLVINSSHDMQVAEIKNQGECIAL